MPDGWELESLLEALGGVGLFLVGMTLLTDGMRALAGEGLARTLRRFTRSPVSGAASGALATAVVQSSSATTVMAVGLAGAGVLTFAQALGIVFGANLGTTITGWMVALLGFKFDLGALAPLLVLAGGLLRTLGSGRTARAGLPLAGFGLVLVGVALLRGGLGGLEGVVTPERFPDDTWLGRLALVGIGCAVTLVTQSSSAGVAAAITAVHGGQMALPQAAAMVIGMDIGTTATAALATVGGTSAARRTGWAHVIYNLCTGAAAFALLPLLLAGIERSAPGLSQSDPELALVAFHTAFNALGVVGILPFAGPFARALERLIPETSAPWTAPLDRRLLAQGELALAAVGGALSGLVEALFAETRRVLRGDPDADPRRLPLFELAIAEIQTYLAQVPAAAPREGPARRIAAFHVVDQTRRLVDRLEQAERAHTTRGDAELRRQAQALADALAEPAAATRLAKPAATLAEQQGAFRGARLARAGPDPEAALAALDAWRWLERIAHHAWRAQHHLEVLRPPAGEG